MLLFAHKNKKSYLCHKIDVMKKSILWTLGCLFLLAACSQKPASLIGLWTVSKVNVQFDENRTTPELVKQVGEMEKQNTLSINSDSLLVFKGLDETWEGRLTLSQGTIIYCDGKLFGEWNNGEIITRTDSPLGEIVVTYQRTSSYRQ